MLVGTASFRILFSFSTTSDAIRSYTVEQMSDVLSRCIQLQIGPFVDFWLGDASWSLYQFYNFFKTAARCDEFL